ncbi:MarR family transcriptional regulator [Zhengella mangrovi]|uniref:MarR family transcriptional regulator n=1 Tax=Zhengella mangrovi TaxID=1982044 RepID=A0A2G1QHV6_9HYPH|nr:MarR family transcriptional regulator [Zhengella mangrovi]PHP64788.1 MarR family transcriptional regulator [Zhengella mangrovi]
MSKSVKENEVACPWSDLDPSGEGLIVHDFLTTRVSALMSALRRQVTQPYASRYGLSISEWRVLSLVAHAGTLPFGDLVVQSTSDKALVSRTIRLLEKRDLLEIVPESKNSKKKIACRITGKGKALHDEAIVIARRSQAEVICSLDREEREALFAIIAKLGKVLEA